MVSPLLQKPFGLSLSKPCPSFIPTAEQPFDKLRANGVCCD